MKPLLKWVGGKSSILEQVLERFPSEMKDYHEPFLGGGSVLFGLLSSNKHKVHGKVYAYDINSDLIYFYQNVQQRPEELIQKVSSLQSEFSALEEKEKEKRAKIKVSSIEEAKTSREHYYYWIRDCFNKEEKRDSPDSSAMLLFLNKTCFRGVYRVGPNGFNVPYGHYKNPSIFDEEHLRQASRLIQSVSFIHSDFSNLKAKEGDFVYLDPPYAPEKSTSFVGYTESGFRLEQHQALFRKVKELPCQFLMSNAAVELVTEEFIGYDIDTIKCRRAINSKKPDSTTEEVLIYN